MLKTGEKRLKVELPERKRRMDLLNRYGLVDTKKAESKHEDDDEDNYSSSSRSRSGRSGEGRSRGSKSISPDREDEGGNNYENEAFENIEAEV